MLKYRTYISIGKNIKGKSVITGKYVTLAEENEIPNYARPIEIKEESDILLLKYPGTRDSFWDRKADKIKLKPKIILVLDKVKIKKKEEGKDKKDKDKAILRFNKVPKKYKELNLIVGDQKVKINIEEGLEITSDTPQYIRIALDELFLIADIVTLEVEDDNP